MCIYRNPLVNLYYRFDWTALTQLWVHFQAIPIQLCLFGESPETFTELGGSMAEKNIKLFRAMSTSFRG